jgi:hypothetical protein
MTVRFPALQGTISGCSTSRAFCGTLDRRGLPGNCSQLGSSRRAASWRIGERNGKLNVPGMGPVSAALAES